MNTSYALITGASKGIGKSIAKELAKRRIDVLLVARLEAELGELALSLQKEYGIKANYLVHDLSQAGAAQKVADWCSQHSYRVHILVNNAGYALWGPFASLSLQEQLNMLQLNMQTLVEMSYLFIPQLKKHPKAYLLNVGSIASYQAVPALSLYAASKAFVLSFSRGLRYELKGSPISVTCLCPGPVNTHFLERAGMQFLQKKSDMFGMSPDSVAKQAVKGMFKRKSEVIPGFLNQVMALCIPIVPKRLVEGIAASLYIKK
jgi:short-subunit dehydrogenase